MSNATPALAACFKKVALKRTRHNLGLTLKMLESLHLKNGVSRETKFRSFSKKIPSLKL